MSKISYSRQDLESIKDGDLPDRGVYCPRCSHFIPSFDDLNKVDEKLMRSLGPSAFDEIQRITGCSSVFAKIWFAHPNGPHEAKVEPPCPYCGEPLFSEKTKQCLKCGWEWHDPNNPKNLLVR